MISRTGDVVGPRGCRGRRGFTLIELMVVILVIGILASILTPVLFRAQAEAKKKWALKELTELTAVISVYHEDQSAYPPDTEDWGGASHSNLGNAEDDPANVDAESIHRYLGRRVVNWRGEEYHAYMSMDPKRVLDADSDDIGLFLDPFGTQYHLDAMHMIPPDPNDPGSGYRQCGWPYLRPMSGIVTDDVKKRMVIEYKFISYGPDTVSVAYPFDMGFLQNPRVTVRTGGARDDICSWE